MDSPSWTDAYHAARADVAFIERSSRGWIVVSGADRRSYLQGLFTNDIEALRPGHGCYAAYLTAQGRMITDLWAYELGDVLLLGLPAAVTATVLAKLDQFIFNEDVQVGDVTSSFASVVLVGPRARECLSRVLGPVTDLAESDELPNHGNRRTMFQGESAILLRVGDCGLPGYEILVPIAASAALRAACLGAGAVLVDADAAEALRVEAGVPVFGRDMDEETIPLEAGIEARAISQTKGCYVGQEVIVRVLHRGHGRVAKKLVGLRADGTAPLPVGAVVTVDAREVGRITSSAFSPSRQAPIALAYLHRDFIAAGTSVVVAGAKAEVTTLPLLP